MLHGLIQNVEIGRAGEAVHEGAPPLNLFRAPAHCDDAIFQPGVENKLLEVRMFVDDFIVSHYLADYLGIRHEHLEFPEHVLEHDWVPFRHLLLLFVEKEVHVGNEPFGVNLDNFVGLPLLLIS